jgi:archaeal cell division control protein 6
MVKQIILSDIIDSNTLFLDKQVVKPNYPLKSIHDILHREAEIEKYYIYLKDIFQNISPNNIFIYGKAGVGKTILTKWVLTEIKNEAKKREIELTIVNVKCDISKTENAIWQTINDQMPIPELEERKRIGNSISKHAKYFEYLVNKYPGIIIIVLDEIDKASSPEIINKIIRMESKASGQFPCVIGITNDLYLYDKFPPYLLSVLSQHELVIKPYDAEQLIDIINARIEMAFKPGVIGESVAAICAAFSAQDNGEARRAVDLLRISGELAEERKSPLVEEIDVRNANNVVEVERVTEVIRSLPTQTKITLLACIYVQNSNMESITSKVYIFYKKICNFLEIEALSQRRMGDLINELDMLGIISINIVYKGRYGRLKQITDIPVKDKVLKILYEDFRLSALSNVLVAKF